MVLSILRRGKPATGCTLAQLLWRFGRRKPLGAAGATTLLLVTIVAAAAPLVAPHDPYRVDLAASLQPPRPGHIFGTDDLGRDIWSRVIVASRYSLAVGITASAAATVLATLIGLVSGYIGGWVDIGIQRLVDSILGIPFLVILLVVMAVIGAGVRNVVIVLGVFFGVTYSRVVRSTVITVKHEDYVTAATLLGASRSRLVMRHIMPNILAPVIVLSSLALGNAILAEASLSFLGYGVPPPHPTLGQMIGLQARPYLVVAPWMAIAPGVMLAAVVFSVHVLGDALRDVLDPRLRF